MNVKNVFVTCAVLSRLKENDAYCWRTSWRRRLKLPGDTKGIVNPPVDELVDAKKKNGTRKEEDERRGS